MTKLIIWLELFLIFVAGPLLFYFNIISFEYWMRGVEVGTLLTIVLSILHKTKIKDLGLRADNLRESFLAFGVLTVLGVIVLLIIRNNVTYYDRDVSFWWRNSFIWYMILINDPIQEFFYRSFMMERLKRINNSPVFVILANALLFTFTHIIFRDLRFLAYVFPAGLLWAITYHRYPNFYAAAASHSVLGGLAMILGLT